MIRAENEIRNAKIQLNHYLGFQPHSNVEYVGKLEDYGTGVDYGEEEAIKLAMVSRPDLRVAQSAIRVAMKDAHIAAGSFLPRVDLQYSNTNFHRDYSERLLTDYSRDYWSVSLRFSWDFFEGGRTAFTVMGERKRIEALKKDYEDAVSTARKEIIRSVIDIAAAERLIQMSKVGIKAAQEGYRMAERRYSTNIGTVTEVLDAQARLSRAESDLSSAQAEYQSARMRYYYHLGKPNPGLR